MSIVVTQLNVYPVKSCGGITLNEVHVEPKGFRHDRRWLVTDLEGMFLTQRELPRLALVQTALTADHLVLRAPDMGEQQIAFGQPGAAQAVTIWKDRGVGAVDQGDEVAGWLSEHLKTPVRLVRFDEAYVRQVDQRYAPRTTDQVGFADGYPFLVISEESLADLNNRLDEPLPMNRFRPNIVVRGTMAYAEDSWKQMRVGDSVTFELVKTCARCAITTTDQVTAQRGKEPLRTLAQYRDSERGVLFGQNMTSNEQGVVRVGDTVAVMA